MTRHKQMASWAARTMRQDESVRIAPQGGICLANFATNARYEITRATIIIPVDYSRAKGRFLDCVVEELSQVMGLPNDSDKVFPSIFNDSSIDSFLTGLDYVLLRLAYHPALQPGMTSDEVRAALPTALKALRANGDIAQATQRVQVDSLKRWRDSERSQKHYSFAFRLSPFAAFRLRLSPSWSCAYPINATRSPWLRVFEERFGKAGTGSSPGWRFLLAPWQITTMLPQELIFRPPEPLLPASSYQRFPTPPAPWLRPAPFSSLLARLTVRAMAFIRCHPHMQIGKALTQLLAALAQGLHGRGGDLVFSVDDDFQAHRVRLHDN